MLNLAKIAVDNEGVIASGPLTKQPATAPYRVTLRATDTGYCIAAQYFWEGCENLSYSPPRPEFGDGKYIEGHHHLAEAVKEFAKVLDEGAIYLTSIFRGETIEHN